MYTRIKYKLTTILGVWTYTLSEYTLMFWYPVSAPSVLNVTFPPPTANEDSAQVIVSGSVGVWRLFWRRWRVTVHVAQGSASATTYDHVTRQWWCGASTLLRQCQGKGASEPTTQTGGRGFAIPLETLVSCCHCPLVRQLPCS